VLSARRGHSLIEALIAIGVGMIVVGLTAMIGFRHQRFHRDVVVAVERTEQLEQIAALMPISLRSIAPGLGDIAPGGARDTSLEFRGAVATSVVCDTVNGAVVLAPVRDAPRLTSVLTRPAAGDTAWVLAHAGAIESWGAKAVTGVADTLATCALNGGYPFGLSALPALTLRFATPLPLPGSVVRVTRPWRYSVYRASDGAWYLGAKEWNPTLGRFNTIQPVGGPFASGSSGLRFTYRDSTGSTVPAASPDPHRIAVIEVSIERLGLTSIALRNRMRAP
jgi:hypothetical protein